MYIMLYGGKLLRAHGSLRALNIFFLIKLYYNLILSVHSVIFFIFIHKKLILIKSTYTAEKDFSLNGVMIMYIISWHNWVK